MYNIPALLSEKTSLFPSTIFIGIDGYAGSGKSSLATLLSEKLGAEIIRIDDFANWDQTFPWHKRLIDEVFIPIQNGAKTLSYAKTSWWENHNPVPAENQPLTPVMILEGVGALRLELQSYIALRIFVETPKKICLERGVLRDLQTGKSKDEIIRIWQTWQAGEETYMDKSKPKQHADIVLNGTIPFETQMSF